MFYKKLFLVIIASVSLSIGVVSLTEPAADAKPSNLSSYTGYFTGRSFGTSGYSRVFNEGIVATTNKEQAISYIESRLSGTTQQRTSAAFIIQTMRGANSGWDRQRPPSSADIQDWKNRIRNPAITIQLTNYSYRWNSAYHPTHNDNIYYSQSDTRYSVIFRHNGIPVYVLKQDCANPVGDLGGLPSYTPANWSTSPGTNIYRLNPATGAKISGPLGNNVTARPGERYGFANTIVQNGPTATHVSVAVDYTYTYPTVSQGWTRHANVGAGVPAGGRIYDSISGHTGTIPPSAQGKSYCLQLRYAPSSSSSSAWRNMNRMCVNVPPPNWSTSPGTNIYRLNPATGEKISGPLGNNVTAQPGERYGFANTIVQNGPTATHVPVAVDYTYTYPTVSQGWTRHRDVGAGVPAGGRIYDLISGHTGTIPPSALGKSYCLQLRYAPSSSSSSAWRYMDRMCVNVPYNFELYPETTRQGSGGDTVDFGTSSVTFRNTVRKTGTTQSKPTLLVTKTFKILPHENDSYPLTYVDGVTSNCDSRWNKGGRCVQDVASTSGIVFTTNGSNAVPAPVSSTTVNISNTSLFPIGTRVCANLALSPPNATNNGARWGVYYCVRIVAKPFFDIRGGDISAGGAIEASGVCGSGNPRADIASWPNAPGFTAAGTQFGAFALGRITGFASAKVNSALNGSRPPVALSFSNYALTNPGIYNATSNPNTEFYGGNFGAAGCISDHWAGQPASMTSVSAGVLGGSAITSGHYMLNSSAIASPVTIQRGKQLITYRDGDLLIRSNILYNRTGWTTTSDIPALKIVVRGDIYLGPGVSELNGVYVAQPRADGTGGNIYTCSQGLSAGSPAVTSNPNYYETCDDSVLTVNGTFSAKKVHLMRTTGTASNGVAAERFIFLPELWQARWPQARNDAANTYDAITGLPPVL